ncbi:hypothetical protein A4A49_12588 [Nicotiana attenuata]|uniref:Uncharacterized protein n=1 Tax=Nicotiana attenuata TaxID=49451 RepID=A0A1J6HX05_NICAT|nr:hypothetical protein A4A49_12588 [Nicotiana attenuata]
MKNTCFMLVFVFFLIGAQFIAVHGRFLTPAGATAGAGANSMGNDMSPQDVSSYGSRRRRSARHVAYFTRTHPGPSERGPGHR